MNYSNQYQIDSNNPLESLTDSFFRSDSRLTSSEVKRKRRSKNDQEGRKYKCDCGKAYLSQLALNNHYKAKHEAKDEQQDDSNLSSYLKIRGRPKKNVFNIKKNYYQRHEFNLESYFSHFFLKEFRHKLQNESEIVLEDYFKRFYNELYQPNNEKFELKLNCFEEHPLHKMLNRQFSSSSFVSNEDLPCDVIFRNYLLFTKDLVNKDYFYFVFLFIILFRECINKYKNVELENSKCILGEQIDEKIKEFTEYFCGEHLPDICNEFICDYLASNNYFGISKEFYSEFIEIVQHFCFWLYENNYTSSKLSFIG